MSGPFNAGSPEGAGTALTQRTREMAASRQAHLGRYDAMSECIAKALVT